VKWCSLRELSWGGGFWYRNLGFVVKVLSYRSESSKNQVSYAPQTLFSLNQLLASELAVYSIHQIFSALNLSIKQSLLASLITVPVSHT